MWKVVATSGPGGRAWNQVAYDGRALVAGGASGGGAYQNDFWAFEKNVWVRHIAYSPTTEPVSREHQAFVHCPKDGKSYWFNGHTGTSANNWSTWPQRKKIWRVSGNAWEDTGKVIYQPELGPGEWAGNPMKMSAGTVWCPPLDGFLIAGGGNWNTRATYLLRHSDLAAQKLKTVGEPTTGMRFNVNNQMQWVAEIEKAALFGGHPSSSGGKTLNDLKLFDPHTLKWITQPTTNAPPGRASAALVHRPGKLAVYGGTYQETHQSPAIRLKDFWELDLATWTWTRLEDAPHDMWFHGGVWDGSRYLFFAGFSSAPGGSANTLAYTPTGNVLISVPGTLSVEVVDG